MLFNTLKQGDEMKNCTIGIWLFTFLGFLVWFYFASNPSSVDQWWTVTTPLHLEVQNGDIQVIRPLYVISPLKVLVGIVVFVLFGAVLSFFLNKSSLK